MQTRPQKFALTLALKLYPQDLIGRAKLFDISAANHNRAENAFSARAFPVWPAKRGVLQRAVCHLAACIDNNVSPHHLAMYKLLFKLERKHQSISESSSF